MKSLGLKCPECDSTGLFIEEATKNCPNSLCQMTVYCNSCLTRHTDVIGHTDSHWTLTGSDLSWNMHLPHMFFGADDYDHFAFHADEEKQK